MSLAEILHEQGFVVLDGGLATELEAKGANLKDPLWSAKLLLEEPRLLEEVNYEYLVAGADVALTASYQATMPGLVAKGLTAQEAASVIRESVDVARRARDRFWAVPLNRAGRLMPLVVASVGPYGAYLHDGSEYRGNYGVSRSDLKDFHRPRLAVLIDAQPDLIAFESIPSQAEAEILVELLSELPELGCWVSFTCRDGECISEGTSFAAAVSSLSNSPRVLAVGMNCVLPKLVTPLLKSARHATELPFVVYPNNGVCFDAATKDWNRGTMNEDIPGMAAEWYRHGARLIGGCCLTTPTIIRGVREALSQLTAVIS